MRFQTIIAHAFGPFRGATLDLAPGMTVVFGPNEAGKSTWHAAIYAALCGMRRARGRARTEDDAFKERHCPWGGVGWDVSASILLEDGRRIEIRQDLDGRVDCAAFDVGAGRDVSSEIIHEGSPDGSKWLGLDREAFFATACIRQAELLSVLEDPATLQEYLQRAADTAGRDETAAAALEALADFQKTHVGVDRANARGPLRMAKENLERLSAELDRARRLHADYLRLIDEAERKAEERTGLERKRRAAARVVAREEARALSAQLGRVRELVEEFAGGPPPAPAAGAEIAQRVAAVVETWENRLPIPELEGPTATELEKELLSLPPLPEGDLEPAPRVTSALARLRTAEGVLAAHERDKPVTAPAPDTGGATTHELRDLARDLAEPQPPVDPVLAERVERARGEVDRTRPAERRRIAVAFALGSLAAGGAVIAAGYTMTGLAIGIAGLLATLGLVLFRDPPAHEHALAELREAESRYGVQEHLRMSVVARRENARKRAESLGLRPDSADLSNLARQLEAAAEAAASFRRWQTRCDELRRDVDRLRGEVRFALRERGVEPSEDLDQSVAHYGDACAEHARLAAQAARATDIQGRLATRREAETAVADARAATDRALATLRQAAAECHLASENPEETLPALREWLASRSAELRRRDALAREYGELEHLLGGRDAAAVVAEMKRRLSEIEAASKADPDVESEEPPDGPRAAALVSSLEGEIQRVDREASGREGAAKERARQLPGVADAEEAVAEAEREFARVRRLESTLERTREFLARAEERVHRDIAQMLADTLRPWLPQITAGRYGDVAVNASDLSVRVRDPDGHWRQAALLSHGTAEQIYLLLRVALAEHLTRKGERCPLLLDEVTVHADRDRTARILDLLHRLSADRQIVLFTQEEDVREWAGRNLAGERDRVIELDGAVR
jgi:DNA repair protein SbcC/Rad50